MAVIVMKFGGTSVATAERLQQINRIIDLDPRRRCVVVSAPGKGPGYDVKVTDQLIRIVQAGIKNEDTTSLVAAVKQRYHGIYRPLGVDAKLIDEVLGDLDRRVAAPHDDERRYRDLIVAAGEDLNAKLFARYLCVTGKEARYVCPADIGLIVTPDFGDAQPLPGIGLQLATLKKICAEKIVVFPGFFGVTAEGEVATFSRGGSDLTGSILAEAIDATEYENWTDVDGIFSAHPQIVSNPLQIPALTYKEMRELSYIGFNVLHEEAVKPVLRKKIPIRLRNTNNLENSGTLIVSERLPSERDVIGIASGSGYCSITLQKFLMNREKGFGRRLFAILEQMELGYEHCPSGVDSISVILDQNQLKPDSVNTMIRKIEEELKPDDIKVEYSITLLAVVGEGLLHKIGVLSLAAGALSRAGVNIKMANQGSSEISMIFGVDASDEKKAVSTLYNEFFRK